MNKEIVSIKSIQPMSRERRYTFARYTDDSALLTIDGDGISMFIHIDKADVERLKGDFNA